MRKLYNKFRRNLISKLGGIPLESIPLKIKQELLNHWMNKQLDRDAFNLFSAGFTTSYVNDHETRS